MHVIHGQIFDIIEFSSANGPKVSHQNFRSTLKVRHTPMTVIHLSINVEERGAMSQVAHKALCGKKQEKFAKSEDITILSSYLRFLKLRSNLAKSTLRRHLVCAFSYSTIFKKIF